jgi:hypothetical protein
MVMIHEIRSIKSLKGAPGKPPYDLEALADPLARLPELPLFSPKFAEAGLHPICLLPRGLLIGAVRVIET